MNQPYLRPPRLDELDVLSRLCQRSKAHWGYDAAFMTACETELTLRQSDLSTGSVAVAEVNDAPVGVARITVTSGVADLELLYVAPEQMGRGIGQSLFDWSTEAAQAAGASRMIIEADPNAVNFYLRMGAVAVGYAPSGSIPGRRLPKLQLNLDAPD